MKRNEQVKHEWKVKLRGIDDSVWQGSIVSNPQLFQRCWWHHKYYVPHPNFDGSKPQRIIGRQECEVPFERKFCRVSTGRFALEHYPVAYFSGDYEVGRTEITRELKRTPRPRFREMILTESTDYDVPLMRFIKKGTRMLDLSRSDSPIIRAIMRHRLHTPAERFYDEVIASESEEVYPITQAISEVAFDHGIRGILFKTVGGPSDFIPCPDLCLVLFGEEYIVEDPQGDDSQTASA